MLLSFWLLFLSAKETTELLTCNNIKHYTKPKVLLSFWLLFLWAKEKVTGRYKARTCDPLNVVQVRYQLRQSPALFYFLRDFGLLVACATFPSIFRYSIEKRSPCQSPALFTWLLALNGYAVASPSARNPQSLAKNFIMLRLSFFASHFPLSLFDCQFFGLQSAYATSSLHQFNINIVRRQA